MANYYTSGYTPPEGISNKNDVRQMQQMLVDAGYSVGSTGVDGVWGKNTQAAYEKYIGASQKKTNPWGLESYLASMGGGYDALYSQALSGSNVPTQKNEKIKAQMEEILRPAYEQAIAARQQQTIANTTDIDVDAASRGMGSSTWVTDAKTRQMDSETSDIAKLESSYQAALAEAILNQQNMNAQLAQNAADREANMALSMYQLGLEQDRWQKEYDLALAQMNRNRSSGGGSGSSSSSGGQSVTYLTPTTAGRLVQSGANGVMNPASIAQALSNGGTLTYKDSSGQQVTVKTSPSYSSAEFDKAISDAMWRAEYY